MFVVEKLKLNKFRQVDLPTPLEYFRRYGLISSGQYSGDDFSPMPENKLDSIHAGECMAFEMENESHDS